MDIELPLFAAAGGAVLGDTADDTPRTLAAVAVDRAQYKQPIVTLVSFSNLVWVSGSNTGKDRALQATFRSVTTFCKLHAKDIHYLESYIKLMHQSIIHLLLIHKISLFDDYNTM